MINIKPRLDKTVELYNKYLETAFKYPPKFSYQENFENADAEWEVTLNEWIFVSYYEGSFQVGYVVFDAGGYWEPPSSDFCEVSDNKTLENALESAISVWLKNDLSNFSTNEYEKNIQSNQEEL